jgi:hypothetical protein
MLRTTRLRVCVLIGLVLAGVLLAGCGDGRLSKSEYSSKADPPINRILKATKEFDTKATTPAEVKANLKTVQNTVDDGVKTVEPLKPPKEWQKYHDDLVGGMKGVSSALADMQTAIDRKQRAALTAASQRMKTNATKVDRAIALINAHNN